MRRAASEPSPRGREWLQETGACLLLAVATLGVYAQVVGFDFVGWDDDRCVYAHPVVAQGLNWETVRWVIENPVCANWTPLAWLSHMLDFELFGHFAGGHHATSLMLHLLNTLLLFGLLRDVTGALWRSACVAALFALHPLHVESVAWIAERRDVLSTAFGLACVWLYARWARGGHPHLYALSCLCLVLGLMSKAMLVTLPLLLLLLDVWPLQRLALGAAARDADGQRAARLAVRLIEKLPFFVAAALCAAATISIQSRGVYMPDTETISLGARIANALVSYVLYLWRALWPTRLAAFYPHPSLPGGAEPWSALEAGAAALALSAVTGLALRARRQPYLMVGWLWYLITLFPAIGMVQVGAAAMADRYTYLPLIGVFVALVFGAWDAIASRGWRPSRARLFATACFALGIFPLAILAWRQVGTWRDSATLFEHAVSVTDGNYTMHFNLANEYKQSGDLDRAREHYERALAIHPAMGEAHQNLAGLLQRQERLDEAILHFHQAALLRPHDRKAMRGLAEAGRARDGSLAVVIDLLRELLEQHPDSVQLHVGLGDVNLAEGKIDAAIRSYRRAQELAPDDPEVRRRLDAALAATRDEQDSSRPRGGEVAD